jgi:hypothetical protein
MAVLPFFVPLIGEFWLRLTEATLLVKLLQQSLVSILSEVHLDYCRCLVVLSQVARKELTETAVRTSAVYLVTKIKSKGANECLEFDRLNEGTELRIIYNLRRGFIFK